MAKQEEVKPNPFSLQKTDQPVLVTSNKFLKKYHSKEFKTKYSQDDSQIARDLSLQIEKNCTLETFPKLNRNIIINVHGSGGEIRIDGSFNGKSYHPIFIASKVQVKLSKEWPLVLDIYACQIGMGISSEKKDKKYEKIYKKKLPNNCFVILNGGNKKSLVELNAQEVERVIDEKDCQKNAYIRFVRKIFHDPETIKLVYKDETGKTSFFKHSALKLEDGQKATIKDIKDWIIEGANKFKEAFIKEIDDVKEQERIRSELEDEIRRLTAELNREKIIKLAEQTILIEAQRGKAKRVEHYLTEDFNPNYYTVKTKTTPLHLATEKGHINTVEALLSYNKVDVNQVNYEGVSPLFRASQKGHIEIFEMLLKRGADPNLALTSDGCTPLFIATQEGKKEIVKMLLDAEVNPNLALTSDGCTPFFMATQKEHIGIVKILLDAGANPNQARSDGCTPIMMAMQTQNIEVTKLLIEKVDLDKNKWQGKTIEDLIQEVITNEVQQKELLEAVQKRRKETLPSPKCSNPESLHHQSIVM